MKTKHKKDLVKSKRIISCLHWISHVSSLNTPKDMFNAMNILYEGNNINRKMTLRIELKDVKMQMSESIQSYFSRVAQIKEQLELVKENVEE